MAAIRCAGAGRALLRRSPGLLRRAPQVGERGLLRQQPTGALSSNRSYMSSYLEEQEKRKLAVALMKERSADNEIRNLEEMLGLINSHADSGLTRLRYPFEKDESLSDSCRQQAAARSAIDKKKHELVSSLLRPESGKEDYMQKMEELAVAVRGHRGSLLLEELKDKYEWLKRKHGRLEELHFMMVAGIMLWGVPLTLVSFAQWH